MSVNESKSEAVGHDAPPNAGQDDTGDEEAGRRGEQVTGVEVRTGLIAGETFAARAVHRRRRPGNL